MKVGLNTAQSRTSVFDRLYALSQRSAETPQSRGQPSPKKQPRPKVELRLIEELQHRQAKLRHQRVVQSLKTQATCTSKPQIEPFSRYLAGLPKGEEAELAMRSQKKVARALKARLTGETKDCSASKTAEVRVCLQQPKGSESVQLYSKAPFSRVTSSGIPYDSLTLQLTLKSDYSREEFEQGQSPENTGRTQDTPFDIASYFRQTTDNCLDHPKYVALAPSSQTVRFASGMNFQAFLAKAKPLVKYDSLASKT